MTTLTVAFPDVLVDVLADAVVERLSATKTPFEDTWMNAEEAARHIGGAPVSRVHDLVQQGKLQPYRDGRRLLFKRSELDAYVEGSR